MPCGVCAAAGLLSGAAGLGALAWLRWWLHHPPPEALIDLHGMLVAAVLGRSATGLLAVVGALAALDAALALLPPK